MLSKWHDQINALWVSEEKCILLLDQLFNYRESKKLQQADLAKLEKVVREQMEEVAKLEMEQERMIKSLHAKD